MTGRNPDQPLCAGGTGSEYYIFPVFHFLLSISSCLLLPDCLPLACSEFLLFAFCAFSSLATYVFILVIVHFQCVLTACHPSVSICPQQLLWSSQPSCRHRTERRQHVQPVSVDSISGIPRVVI